MVDLTFQFLRDKASVIKLVDLVRPFPTSFLPPMTSIQSSTCWAMIVTFRQTFSKLLHYKHVQSWCMPGLCHIWVHVRIKECTILTGNMEKRAIRTCVTISNACLGWTIVLIYLYCNFIVNYSIWSYLIMPVLAIHTIYFCFVDELCSFLLLQLLVWNTR